jgi:hypothetical protein
MAAKPDPTVTINLTDLESLIRRVVQQTVRDEFAHLLRKPDRLVLEYWEHEGPDDPGGDEKLLAEALEMISQHEKDTTGWKTLEEFEEELAQAEVAHVLPA